MRLLAWALCLAFCAAAPARASSLEEMEVAQKLSREATEFMDQLLGPGRARVLLTVEGESSEVHTESEVVTPVRVPLPQAAPLDSGGGELPGYAARDPAPPGERKEEEYLQKDRERSARRRSFQISRLRVAVVLDQGLSDDQVNTVRRVLPGFLRMDEGRGDEMSVLRAPLRSPWRKFWSDPAVMRLLLVLLGAAGLVLLAGFLGYATAMQVVRAFAAEVASRRAPLGPEAPAALPGRELPELSAGGLPGLLEGAGEEAEPGAAPALGRRFDFLSSREPAEVGALIAKEPPADLALLFAYLADAHPDLSSRIFAHLPPATQNEASAALAGLERADPAKLDELEERLRAAVEYGVRGHERLSRILSRMPAQEREGVLGELMNRDPRQAQEVERSLFSFDDVANLKPEALRRLIVAVPYGDWGAALRGAAPELAEKVYAELTPGTRVLVREAAEVPQPKDKVLEARSKILTQALALAAKGQIELGQPGASSELI